jgi:hypothetical protein
MAANRPPPPVPLLTVTVTLAVDDPLAFVAVNV